MNQKYIYGKISLILLTIFSFNLLIKKIIIDDFFLQDDLIYIPKILNGEPFHWPSYPIFSLSMNYGVGLINNIFLIKLYLVFIVALTGAIFYDLTRHFFHHEYLLMIGLVIAFTSPMNLEMGTFISGSYPAVGLLFMTIGLWFSLGVFRGEFNISKRRIFLLNSVLFLGLSTITSPFCFLAPLLVLFNNKTPSLLQTNTTQYIRLLLINLVAPYTIVLFWSLTFGKSYHYTKMEGWTEISLSNTLNQLRALKTAILESYSLNSPIKYLIYLIFLGLCCYFISLSYVLIKRIFLKYKNKNDFSDSIISLQHLAFFPAGLMISILPTLVLTSVGYRYLYALSIFLWSCLFFLADRLIKQFNLKYLGFLVGIIILIGNVFANYNLHEGYRETAQLQSNLSNFIKQEEANWKNQGQIIFIVKRLPKGFTNGYNHWSTWFLRYHSNRNDINGIIGTKSMMAFEPFIEKYQDHSKYFWRIGESRGKSKIIRKSMIGIITDQPIYIYQFDANNVPIKQINWIMIVDRDNSRLYSATSDGVIQVSEFKTEKRQEVLRLHNINSENEVAIFSLSLSD